MMTQGNLHREYGRCVDTLGKDKAYTGVKLHGEVMCGHPRFNQSPEDYEFFVAVVEDTPVFVNDVIYDEYGRAWSVGEGGLRSYGDFRDIPLWSLYTLKLNENLPHPVKSGKFYSQIGTEIYYFRTAEDLNTVHKFLHNMFSGALNR